MGLKVNTNLNLPKEWTTTLINESGDGRTEKVTLQSIPENLHHPPTFE
jgi:hypothetical protein